MAEPRGVPEAPHWSKLTARNPTGDANEAMYALKKEANNHLCTK